MKGTTSRFVSQLLVAPRLTRLSELGHAFRIVANERHDNLWTWHGDLAEPHQRSIYQAMLWQQHTLTQLTVYKNGLRILVAQIKEDRDPAAAYVASADWLAASAGYSGFEARALLVRQRRSLGWKRR